MSLVSHCRRLQARRPPSRLRPAQHAAPVYTLLTLARSSARARVGVARTCPSRAGAAQCADLPLRALGARCRWARWLRALPALTRRGQGRASGDIRGQRREPRRGGAAKRDGLVPRRALRRRDGVPPPGRLFRQLAALREGRARSCCSASLSRACRCARRRRRGRSRDRRAARVPQRLPFTVGVARLTHDAAVRGGVDGSAGDGVAPRRGPRASACLLSALTVGTALAAAAAVIARHADDGGDDAMGAPPPASREGRRARAAQPRSSARSTPFSIVLVPSVFVGDVRAADASLSLPYALSLESFAFIGRARRTRRGRRRVATFIFPVRGLPQLFAHVWGSRRAGGSRSRARDLRARAAVGPMPA